MEITPEELRARARGKLFRRDGVPGYGTFLVGLLLMGVIVSLASAVASCAVVGGLALVLEKFNEKLTEPAAILICYFFYALLVIVIFYLLGVVRWTQKTMSLAAVRDTLAIDQGVSGWGHGWRMVVLTLWEHTFIFLWSLLLIVPGIRAFFSYAMAPYLSIDHPDWSARTCIAESKRMMEGHRLRYFYLCVSFIGWWILSILINQVTFFGGNWLFTPYFGTASAAFYADLLNRGESTAASAPAEPSDLGWPLDSGTENRYN